MRIIIAAGGSGGHLYPAVAIIKVLQRNPANEIFLLTSVRGQGEAVLQKLGIRGRLLNMRGLPRRFSGELLAFIRELLAAQAEVKDIFIQFKPEIVLGHGGYVTFPALFQAWRQGVPYCLQEQNVLPGLVTRLFWKSARRVFGNNLQLNSPLAVNCGNPVRDGLWEHDPRASREFFGLSPDKFTLLILGGSQGARSINRASLGAVSELTVRHNLQVIWSVGEANYKEMQRMLKPGMAVKIAPFIEEMGEAYMAADLVISRAGATTISELNACGRPAVLIPYPHATHNHQFHNAREQVNQGAALILEEKHLSAAKLLSLVKDLINEPARLRSLAENSLRIGRRQAAPYIVAEMNNVLDELQESDLE